MSERIKVAFCIPSLGSGGAERVTSILANKFAERGYDVSVIMLSHMLCVYPISPKAKLISLDCDADADMHYLKRFLTRLKKIRRAVKDICPDVVISFMSEPNIDVCFALAGMKIPVIVSERNDPAIDPASKAKQIMRRLAYLKPAHFVFQTPDAQAYFSKRIRKKSTIILNPLSDKLIAPFEGEREKRMVAVGRLNAQKNFPLLIDAFFEFSKVNSEYTLEIYGEGSLENEIRQYIDSKNLGNKIVLKGFCKDVHEKILNAGVFVMSSDFEGMPNALLEALAIGLPCISTDCPCGGPRMLIEPYKNGILVPIKDREKLTAAMCYMANDPQSAKNMSLNAIKIRERADVETITKQWLDVVEACKEKKHATFSKGK